MSVADLLPMLGLRIRCGPRLELRGLLDEHLPLLGELALDVHAPDRMPFFVPWTAAPPEEIPRNQAQYHWSKRADFSPARWSLDLGVWWDGELVGAQGYSTENFLVTRTGETGSWLGRRHQGQGIGTAMRRAICAFVLDHLDAAEVTSGAFLDNPQSLGVSRKVGYRPNGVRRHLRQGQMAELQLLVLTAADLVRGPDLEVEGLAPFRSSIGLDG